MSQRPSNVLFLSTNEIPVHVTLLFFCFFCCKGAIYYVAIATVIFSHVKITHVIFTCKDIRPVI